MLRLKICDSIRANWLFHAEIKNETKLIKYPFIFNVFRIEFSESPNQIISESSPILQIIQLLEHNQKRLTVTFRVKTIGKSMNKDGRRSTSID